MSLQAVRFTTFCHISELGSPGYQDLHRMLAASNPLTLWAPSSVLLRTSGCRISPSQFLDYVNSGHIRIVARRKWLIDREARDTHRWDGARWDPQVDNEVRRVMEEDLGKERQLRRVVAADDERGLQLAEETVGADPDAVREWERLLSRENEQEAERVIPPGTLQTAREIGGDDIRRQVVIVLRDAFNHGLAMAESDASVPFLMRAADREFINRISAMHYGPQGVNAPQPAITPRSQDSELAAITAQLVEVLRTIETDKTDIGRFIGTPEHAAMVAWVDAICERVKWGGATATNMTVAHGLVEELTRSGFPGLSLAELRRHASIAEKLAAALGVVDIEYALSPLMHGSADLKALLGLIASVFPVGHGMLKRVGWVPGQFEGTQWPFLYAGTEATRRSRDKMIKILSSTTG